MYRNVNELVREGVFTAPNRIVTLKEERAYMKNLLEALKKGKELTVVMQVSSWVIGSFGLRFGRHSASHTAEFFIGIVKEYRNIGMGTESIKLAIKLAKKYRVKVLKLTVVAENKKAYRLYKRNGFKKVGIMPKARKYRGKYYDEIIMVKGI